MARVARVCADASPSARLREGVHRAVPYVVPYVVRGCVFLGARRQSRLVATDRFLGTRGRRRSRVSRPRRCVGLADAEPRGESEGIRDQLAGV